MVFQASLSHMRFFDWMALILCNGVVALAINSELRDTMLCDAMIARAGVSRTSHWGLFCIFLSAFRRYVIERHHPYQHRHYCPSF